MVSNKSTEFGKVNGSQYTELETGELRMLRYVAAFHPHPLGITSSWYPEGSNKDYWTHLLCGLRYQGEGRSERRSRNTRVGHSLNYLLLGRQELGLGSTRTTRQQPKD